MKNENRIRHLDIEGSLILRFKESKWKKKKKKHHVREVVEEKSPQDYFCENVQYMYAEKDRWYQFVIRFFFPNKCKYFKKIWT